MSLKPKYPMTIAAVNVAITALSGAIEIAKAEGIDVRTYVLKRDWLLTELHLLEDMVLDSSDKMIPIEVANVLVNLPKFQRDLARLVREQEPFEPQTDDQAKACGCLVVKGVLEHDKSKDRYIVSLVYRDHLGPRKALV
jgi:hypothetical protein